MTHAKCLIMSGREIARATIEKMGLDPEEWEPRSYYQGLLGSRWTVAVIVKPDEGWQLYHRDMIDHYRTKAETVIIL